jgi:hypothetical protein
MKTTLVNVRWPEWIEAVNAGRAVYIGRAVHRSKIPLVNVTSPFANPFKIGMDREKAILSLCRRGVPRRWSERLSLPPRLDRAGSVECYRHMFDPRWYAGQALRAHAYAHLRGMVLGCWCKPEACHGDVILEYLEATA